MGLHNPPPLYPPRVEQSVTAAGGITPVTTELHIRGDGGPIDITVDPQIAAGVESQLLILHGQDDTNTVTLESGNGLHLHSGEAIIGNHDIMALVYGAELAHWNEHYRNFPRSEKSWTFASRTGASGIQYAGGFYEFASTHNDFSPSVNFGTANASKAAHFFVVLGANTVDELVIRITGTTITDSGTRATTQTEDITIPNGTAANAYFETAKKWLGQVAVVVLSGTAQDCNYGFTKYWDNTNSDFRVMGLEATYRGGANDANPDILLRHHKATGWTYNAGSTPSPPTALASMATDHSTEKQLVNGEDGAWKRTNLNTTVMGNDGEGIIIEIVTTANRAFEIGNILVTIRPN